MNSIVDNVIKECNYQTLRMNGLDKGNRYKKSFVISDAENDKLNIILETTNLNISEVIRCSIHFFCDAVKYKGE